MELKSVMETDQHSRNSGNGSRKNNRFGLIAFHNCKIPWDWYKRFTLTQPLRLLWIKGSLDPHKAEGHHGPSHIGPLIEVASGERKGRLLKRCTYIQPISRWLGNHGKEGRLLEDAHILNRFLDGWETVGKKSVVFPMGIWWSKQGQGVHTF